MFQTAFMASWALWVIPRPPHRVPTMPTTSPTPEPWMVWMPWIWVPNTGNWAMMVAVTRSCSPWSLASAYPSTVTNTSSSGNNDKKP